MILCQRSEIVWLYGLCGVSAGDVDGARFTGSPSEALETLIQVQLSCYEYMVVKGWNEVGIIRVDMCWCLDCHGIDPINQIETLKKVRSSGVEDQKS
jgi:hypothetical protein